MENDFVKEYWENSAKKYKESYCASWGDRFCINLETKLIREYLKDGFAVLDIGCSNGHATLEQAQKVALEKIVGIDYSEAMIEQARCSKKEAKDLMCEVEFSCGDVRDIPFADESFDIAYTTRVLINLSNWTEQKRAINECLRVVKRDGLVILSEAFWEPLMLLNSMRQLVNLKPLVEHDFNRYLKERALEEFLVQHHIEFQKIEFSAVYYLGSRFLRELITDFSNYEGYENPINELFCNIACKYRGGGFGIQQAYILKKS